MRISARQTISILTLLAGCVGEVGTAEELRAAAVAAEMDAGRTANQQTPSADAGVTQAPGANPAPAAGGGSPACPSGQQRALATGLRIREVSIYQTVKVPVYQGGTWVTNRPVPLIQGRQALARVFVDTLAGYRPRSVRAVLTLQNGQNATVLTNDKSLSGNSTDADLNSTFTFNVAGAQIGPSTQMNVSLQEVACSASPSTAVATDARVPASGTQAVGASATGKLRVVIVPVRVAGRLPATTEKDVADIRAALFAYYPVPSVEVTVRKPLEWPTAISPSSQQAWSNLLNQIMRERSVDRAAPDVYYFGLMQPAASFTTFCGRGCILGIAPQATRVSPGAQVGLGVSFTEARNQTMETIVHELGHAHGRGHAPCVTGGRIAGVDTRFPDKSGATAIWGWDNRTNALYPPTHKDVMGYCRPNWISAYTYAALAARSKDVNRQAYILPPLSGVRWQSLIAYDDGTNRWGGTTELTQPGGDPEPASVLDSAGQVIQQIEVVRMGLSHSTDQFLYMPEPGRDWASVQLSDRTIELSKVEAPL